MHPALGLLIAYLCGSVPFAYLAGRLVKGIDLRTVGSGNLGATNVYRTMGAPAAIVVLLLDAAKGALPVLLLPRWLAVGNGEPALWWALAFGIAAIAGHAKPIFLLWKGGGKGVATAGGVFAALAPWAVLGTVVLFVLVVMLTRYVSLGSLAAAISLPFFVWYWQGASSVLWVGIGVAAFVWWTHRGNLRRLFAGTEPQIGRTAEGLS